MKPKSLQAAGIRPKKMSSQHFLVDDNITRKIVQAANACPGDLVLEIGPGPGALTRFLLDSGAHVLAVEKDPELAQRLMTWDDPRLEVVEGDIREFPIAEALRERLATGQRAKVVANLPYHLSTPILKALLPLHSCVQTLTIMVQREFAEKLLAQPSSPGYGPISVQTQLFSDGRMAFQVSPTCFYPPPRVRSTVMTLQLHEPPLEDTESFLSLVEQAFAQRRKTLRAALRANSISLPDEFANLRAEQLSLQQFVKLAATACAAHADDKY